MKNIFSHSQNFSFKLLIIGVGFTSIGTQIIFINELLNIFYGNELVMDILFLNWMLITAFGCFSGRYFCHIHYLNRFFVVLLTLLPVISMLSLFYGTKITIFYYPIGSMFSLITIWLLSFSMLIPFCFTSGFLFTLLSFIYSKTNFDFSIEKIYSFKSIGSAIGGIVINIVLVFYLFAFQSLIFILLVYYIILAFFLHHLISAKKEYSGHPIGEEIKL
jgi:hypothetical protein